MTSTTWAVGLAASLALGSSPAAATCAMTKVVELPVTMEGFTPLTPAEVNGTPLNFVVDSGAASTSIARARAEQLKLKLRRLSFRYRVMGVAGDADAFGTRLDRFNLAGANFSDVEVMVVSQSETHDTAGLIGQDILGGADVEFDLGHGAVRLFKPADCGDKALAYWAGGRNLSVISLIPLEPKSRRSFGEAYVNGKRITVLFDTGAYRSLLSKRAAERAGVDMDGPGVRKSGKVVGVGGGSFASWVAPVASFKLGDEEIRNTQLQIGDFDTEADMLVGADFFMSHRVYVANSQRKLYFTYERGPVFNLKADRLEPAAAPASDEAEPTDADGFARRGAVRRTKKDYAGAADDFTRALALAPNEVRYYRLRAETHVENHQIFLAMADLDQALKLKPDDGELLIERAALKLSGADRQGALTDLDAAAKATARESDLQLQLAELYQRADQFDGAISAYGKWLAAHEDHTATARALNGRCWARAQLGTGLDLALKDCNRALALAPATALMLDSRGLVHLRRGENEAALADYDAALALNAKLAWALLGRGLAKTRLGQKDAGQADLTAGLAINPKLKDLFLKRGVAKPGEL